MALLGGVRIGVRLARESDGFISDLRYLYGAFAYFLVIKHLPKPAENLPDDPAM
jgi:hypothetical protein